MAIIQTQTQKQTQKLTSQQIQLHNILALPTVALEQYIANEMAINPALEFDNDIQEDSPEEKAEETEVTEYASDDAISEGKLGEDFDHTDYMDRESLDDYKYEANNHSNEDDKREQVYLESHDFTTLLVDQLSLLLISDREKELGEYIINSLEADGYLRRKMSDIADELSFVQNTFVTEEELDSVLKTIHTLEPIGIGARNLQECLLLQLQHKKEKTRDTFNAINIIKNSMEDLSQKKFDKIRSDLKLSLEDIEDAIAEIRKLNPVPAGSSKENSKSAVTIEPDFSVTVTEDKVELFLNSSKHPPLKISDEYTEMLATYASAKDKSMREASGFIKSKVESAKWFIEALQQREKTMITVARAIVKHQKKFFITGDQSDLRPLILKTIAEEINSDISTISRIASSKYIQTVYGTLLIKDLFVEGLSTVNGESVSTNEVKLKLMECVKTEDKANPLSDEEIAKQLMERNYSIARRTVAKYREELKIPSKNFRKVA
ncbi:MAG: RNA polymerase factor sigma-54 [Bacteroidota bacterium]